jgi:hypothetical protein
MFITYTHFDQVRSKAKKRQVQSYQNIRRSQVRVNLPRLEGGSAGPRRPRILQWHRATQVEGVSVDAQEEQQDDSTLWILDAESKIEALFERSPMDTTLQSLRSDPFESYPIKSTRLVKINVDYCSCSHTSRVSLC